MTLRAYRRMAERLAAYVLADYRLSPAARAEEVERLTVQLQEAITAYLESLGVEPEP